MSQATATVPAPRLLERYRAEIRPRLLADGGYSNIMEVASLEKIVLNVGVGEAIKDARILDAAVDDLAVITGQKPQITKARKSIAAFKLREGMPIGVKVTLRGPRMWEFMDRLVSIALPRIRNFRGLNAYAFDGTGNYTIGVTEHLIFPEIDYDKVNQIRGMDITIVTTAKTDEQGEALLRELGLPLQDKRTAAEAAV